MRILRVIIPCLLLQACMFGTSKNAQFYTLTATATQPISATYANFVGVSRIELPKYVDRPQIVTQRKNSNQVNISEFNRWVEPPSVLATRVLTENLSVLLPAAQVKQTYLKGGNFDWTVVVEIIQMNVTLGEQAQLVAWCTVRDSSGKVQTNQKFESTVQVGKSYDDLAQTYSQLLAGLSQEIAAMLLKQ